MKKYIIILTVAIIFFGITNIILCFTGRNENTSTEIQTNEDINTLILVNSENKLPDDYKISLCKTQNGEYVAECIYPHLNDLFEAAQEQGFSPEITSGYRSEKEQKKLYNSRVREYLRQGYSLKESKNLAGEYAAEPGHSEHETGLAVDINSSTGDKWEFYYRMAENCSKYGFILRYPEGKEDITGIEYEPWHFRYVGKEAAEYIYKNNLTLEEYTEAQSSSNSLRISSRTLFSILDT